MNEAFFLLEKYKLHLIYFFYISYQSLNVNVQVISRSFIA